MRSLTTVTARKCTGIWLAFSARIMEAVRYDSMVNLYARMESFYLRIC